MLPNTDHPVAFAGLSWSDIIHIHDHAYLHVFNPQNHNLTPAEKKLMLWHYQFGHCDMAQVQCLFAPPNNLFTIEDLHCQGSFLKAKFPSMSGLHHPLPIYTACCLGKMTQLSSHPCDLSSGCPHHLKTLPCGKVTPGPCMSIGKYLSGIPGHLPNMMGWEATKDQYRGGTLFVNHASGFIFIKHQVSLSFGETLIGKHQFEQYALQFSITIESYHADNALF